MTSTRIWTSLLLLAGAIPALAGESYDAGGYTGTLYYELSFDVPQARGRYKPELLLRYGGQQGEISANGATWGIPPEPFVSQEPLDERHVATKVYRYRDFRNPDKLLLASPRDGSPGVTHWNADVEDEYMDVWQPQVNSAPDLNTFCARDGDGNTYRFESISPVQNSGQDARWALKQVVDLDGNVAEYSHDATNANHLTSIRYNSYGAQPMPSSDRTQCPLMTGPGGADLSFSTELRLEYGFFPGIDEAYLLRILVKNACTSPACGPAQQITVRRYEFTYAQKWVTWHSPDGTWTTTYALNLLQSVTEYGGDSQVARPPTVFGYQALGTDADPLVKQAHLTSVTTPLGARREIIWSESSQFGDTLETSYPVVRRITTTGPGLAPHSVEYGYGGMTTQFHGFPDSWATDSATGIVKHTRWYTGWAFLGRESLVEYGARTAPDSFPTLTSYAPPTFSVFLTERSDQDQALVIATPGSTPSCTVSNPGTPVIPVRLLQQRTRHIDGVQLSSRRSVACGAIDTWGNVHQTSVDLDTSTTGDEYVENGTFEVDFGSAATCKNCVREQTRTDPTKTAPNDRLEATYFEYGSTYQVSRTFRQVAAVANPAAYRGSPSYPCVSASVFNPDGTLQSRTEGSVTTSYTYDAFRLRPETVSVSDATSTLATTTLYDDFGRPYSVAGPSVAGRSDPAATKYLAYDALGRTRVIAQQPISGTLIQSAVQAFEYAEFSGNVPASTTTYEFAVPKSYTDPAVPQTGDVRQTVVWGDGLGREIQTRQRMGDPLSGSMDAAAGVTQNLSNFRVAKAIRYDGAGRVTASIQPYYSVNGGYLDLTNASAIDAIMNPAQSVRVDLTSYDSQGRISCNVTRNALDAGTAAIPAVGTCVSRFAEDANYARATLTTYRGATVGGKGYLAVKTLPPENNYSGGPMVGSESFSDSAGQLRWTTDAEGNITRFAYDLIGRQWKTTREMTVSSGSLAPSTRPTTVDTRLTLDLMGRTVQRTDPNMGRRTFIFDDGVSATLPVTIRFEKTGDEIRYTYDKGRIKQTKLCTNTGGVLGCTVDSTLYYDIPYTTSSSYAYTGGRVSYATNASATIAFGYDQVGSIVRRDQWFAGIPGGFGSADTPRLDGQSVASGLTTPYGNSSWALSYDSAARPVQLSNGTVGYWAATGSAATGAYDALGQLGSAGLDGTLANQAWTYRVTQNWTYAPASALLSSERVRFGTAGADVYQVDSLRYRGTKLESFVDTLSATTYGYWYSHTGRLVAARATPGGSSQLAQNTLVCLTYNATKAYAPGPSLGNIERTRESVSSPPYTSDYSYSGVDVEMGGASPHLGGPDAPASAGSTALGYDDYGRIVTTGAGAETFGYDLLGRMTSITRQGGTSEKLFYDPFGALVQRQVGSTVYSYVGKRATVTGTLAAGCQTASCGVVVSAVDVHVTLGSRRIASVRIYPAAAPRTLYYYRDRLGSVVATTLDGGRAGASYRYSAYGALEIAVGESSDSASEIGYTGALKLSGGLLSMGARVYNPALKIWMQPDPLEPFKYDYADGDPINKTDPTGLLAGADDVIVIGGISGGTVALFAGGANSFVRCRLVGRDLAQRPLFEWSNTESDG